MRISIFFRPASHKLVLPIHYNYSITSFIYRSLDDEIATFYHDGGFAFGKRRYKLFTFSRLLAKDRQVVGDRGNRKMVFSGEICLKFGTMDMKLLDSLIAHLMRTEKFSLDGNVCNVDRIEVDRPMDHIDRPLLVKAISPITIHSTLVDSRGKRKIHYYTPFNSSFSEMILENLARKAEAYYGTKSLPPLNDDHYIKPVLISGKSKVVIRYKPKSRGEVWIEGWLGNYEVNLPEPYFEIAYNAGFGARNSQGFGMVEVIGVKN